MTEVRTIRELDELPDGTTIEIQDKRDTPLFKRDGNWYSPSKTATQNMIAYVNVRRWGVAVIERGPEQ
ncbi:hypothetical protein SEA_HANK144_65 [Streptomyces phage Hank144]|uniref:Uncharacterized protein n=1 Tax=Streptomyces phage Hank144 TaxID=2301573 RepID=A0A385DQM6_9CAUD|nr:hypothetical protein KGG76_gp65 [Streptomyces phage Hank144]AXQ61118.1 hypothetical protein SEA_HANK144_65 [Streptomyces phage Hank144]